MQEFINDSGYGIWPVLVFGIAFVIASFRHVRGIRSEGIGLAVSLGSLTLVMGALGTAMGIQRSAQAMPEVVSDERWIFLVGLGESMGSAIAALALVAIGLLAFVAGTFRPTPHGMPSREGALS